MAKFKQSSKNSSGRSRQEESERLSRTLSDSAQQIWLAGVGAFGRAQVEGTKLFDGLVKEGLNLEQSARRFAGGQAEVVRGAVESGVDTARLRAADTWGRMETMFEDRVHRVLGKLDVPGREDLTDLGRRVDTLTAELRKRGSTGTAAGAPAAKTGGRKTTAKKATTKKTTAKKATAKKATGKSASAKPAVSKRAQSPDARTAKAKPGAPRKAATRKTARPAAKR